jgi:TPR repeat protein
MKKGTKNNFIKLFVLLVFIATLISCNNEKNKNEKINMEDLKSLSGEELEKIGFEKISNNLTFDDGIKILEEAAYKGSSKSALEVGLRYAWGRGVNINNSKAYTLLKKANYDLDAKFALGKIKFFTAGEYPIMKDDDYKEAYKYFQSVTYGSNDNAAEYMLGYMNYYGLGVLVDYSAAFMYFEASTKRPNMILFIWQICLD